MFFDAVFSIFSISTRSFRINELNFWPSDTPCGLKLLIEVTYVPLFPFWYFHYLIPTPVKEARYGGGLSWMVMSPDWAMNSLTQMKMILTPGMGTVLNYNDDVIVVVLWHYNVSMGTLLCFHGGTIVFLLGRFFVPMQTLLYFHADVILFLWGHKWVLMGTLFCFIITLISII